MKQVSSRGGIWYRGGYGEMDLSRSNVRWPSTWKAPLSNSLL